MEITKPIDVLDDPIMMIAALEFEILRSDGAFKAEKSKRIFFVALGFLGGTMATTLVGWVCT